MTISLPRFDLLRERRLELGLPPDPPRPAKASRLLLIGAAIGGSLLVATLALSLVLRLQQYLQARELARLAPVRGQVEALDQQLAAGKALIDQRRQADDALAAALVAVRSGSALMTDLARRTPRELQLTTVRVSQAELVLKGRTGDPGAFERINALMLRLQASPLLDPAAVRLVRAARAGSDPNNPKKGSEGGPVEFELQAGFRDPPSWAEKLRLLQQLEAGGMARRLELLQKEGVLR